MEIYISFIYEGGLYNKGDKYAEQSNFEYFKLPVD